VNRRRAVLPVLAAVLLLAGCVQPTEPLRPLVSPKPTEGIVISVSGGVQVSSGTTWVDVEPGDTVGAGATIRTDADGYCELQFGGTLSVRVEPETQFRCGSVAVGAKTAVSGELTAGAILAKVKKLSGSDLQVRTSSTVVGVRGTAFKVRVSDDVTTVTVREGTVSVTREGTTVDLDAGQRAEAAPTVAPTPEPAAAEDLEAIDAFEPSTVDTADVKKLVKVLVIVEQADAEIWLGTIRVGRGRWGAVLAEGIPHTLYLKHEGYEPEPVHLPEQGRKAARITRRLKPLAAPPKPVETKSPETQSTAESASLTTAAKPAASVTAPAKPGPAASPTPAPAETSSGVVERKVDEPPAETLPVAPLKGTAFRVDPAIGNDPFFKWAAQQFEKKVSGFSLVAEPGGAEIIIGIDDRTSFNYELLPQVAAKRLRPLDGWVDTAQILDVLVNAVRVGRKVYGVPIGGSSPILYYNKDFVRDTPPGTWLEIVALRQALAPDEVEALVMPTGDPFHMGMFIESRDVPLLVPDTDRSGLGSDAAGMVYDAMQEALRDADVPTGLRQQDAFDRFLDRKAAMLIDGPGSFKMLRNALRGSLGVATLPSWGAPPVPMRPYANVLALFVSNTVSEERAAVLREFFVFLLEEKSQLELCLTRLKNDAPIAPALRYLEGETGRQIREETVISVLHQQLKTAVPMPHGPPARDAWWAFSEVLANLEHQELGQGLADMAGARFVLYGLQRRPVPAGGREVRAFIDPAEKSQGLFFVPEYQGEEASDLRLVKLGGSGGVVSIKNVGTFANRGGQSLVYLIVNHAPYRAGNAPPLRGLIEYFDEPNAELRIIYDSKDRSVRKDPTDSDTWGAWKEATVIECTGERRWKQVPFLIPDAQFDGRCNGADLCIEVAARGNKPAVKAVILTPVK
jgi:ABC-type glycerol-3-phosphate transport system substrate-binding protein